MQFGLPSWGPTRIRPRAEGGCQAAALPFADLPFPSARFSVESAPFGRRPQDDQHHCERLDPSPHLPVQSVRRQPSGQRPVQSRNQQVPSRTRPSGERGAGGASAGTHLLCQRSAQLFDRHDSNKSPRCFVRSAATVPLSAGSFPGNFELEKLCSLSHGRGGGGGETCSHFLYSEPKETIEKSHRFWAGA